MPIIICEPVVHADLCKNELLKLDSIHCIVSCTNDGIWWPMECRFTLQGVRFGTLFCVAAPASHSLPLYSFLSCKATASQYLASAVPVWRNASAKLELKWLRLTWTARLSKGFLAQNSFAGLVSGRTMDHALAGRESIWFWGTVGNAENPVCVAGPGD